MAKANKTPNAAPAATVLPVGNNPILIAVHQQQQNQGKITALATKLAKLETDKQQLEAELTVLLGMPNGQTVATVTPKGKAVGTPSAPAPAVAAGTTPTGKRRGRPPGSGKKKAEGEASADKGARPGPKTENTMSLGDVLYEVVKDADEGKSVAELATAALEKGYKSSSSSFPKVVRQVLSTDSRFKAHKDGNNVKYTSV